MYHILIVDEEEHLLWALERNLFPGREDIRVHTALSGEEGLAILDREAVDLLISDIKMPGDVDGFQLILRAKEMVPDARVMIITAFGTHRIQNFAERIGISHYIEKPFTVDELRGAILEILNEKEGFQGVLSDLELTDIIQMLCLAKRTALLHLKHRDHRGRIVFDAGEVVHAEFDGITGAEAVYEMLDLRQGDIFMQTDYVPSERTIEMGWQDLLLEGVRRTDERRMEEATSNNQRLEEASEAQSDEPPKERTLTPMGMGIAGEGLGGETSSALAFSEAELEEISMAGEAAASGSWARVEEELESSEPSVENTGTFFGAPAYEYDEEEEFVIIEEPLATGERESPFRSEPPTRQLSIAELQSSIQEESEAFSKELSTAEVGHSKVAPSEVDTEAGETEAGERKRRGTSPGMTAVVNQPQGITEESGEFELFAAPALNGRYFEEDRVFSEREQRALEEFVRECPGLRATSLFSVESGVIQESMTLTNLDDFDEAGVVARMAEIFSRAQRAVQALSRKDGLEEVQLGLGDQYALLRSIEGTSTIHLVLLERQVSLGIALVLMRQLGRQLHREEGGADGVLVD